MALPWAAVTGFYSSIDTFFVVAKINVTRKRVCFSLLSHGEWMFTILHAVDLYIQRVICMCMLILVSMQPLHIYAHALTYTFLSLNHKQDGWAPLATCIRSGRSRYKECSCTRKITWKRWVMHVSGGVCTLIWNQGEIQTRFGNVYYQSHCNVSCSPFLCLHLSIDWRVIWASKSNYKQKF